MASPDLVEQLQLNDYYPQKLSFSEAIRLRGRSQNGCPKQYGVEIVRRLLMFDFKAVDSVTTEINDRPINRGNKETDIKEQVASGVVRSSRKTKSQKLHPMDILAAVMNCCDDFLRQALVERMFINKLSIPILLPDVRNHSSTLLLLALRSLVPEVTNRIQGSPSPLTDTLIDIKNPVVSFIGVGDLHRSKSKLLNELLNFKSFNAFFHRECSNGYAKRSVSNGSIEAAWFQSEIASEFNCKFFTALNLRGDARKYPNQTQFLCQSSTLVVFMVDSLEKFKAMYKDILKDVDMSQRKIIACHISPNCPDEDDEAYIAVKNDISGFGTICAVKCDWNDDERISDIDFTTDLRNTISELFKPKQGYSDEMPTFGNIVQRGGKFGFSIDEDKSEYKKGRSSADEFFNLVLKQAPDCKPMILPLQGKPWVEIGKLKRRQLGKSLNESQDEYFIAKKEAEKRHQREIQCCSLIQQNEITQTFYRKFHLLQEKSLSYYLNSCKLKLDARSRDIISKLLDEYQKVRQKLPNQVETKDKISDVESKMENSSIGMEHILRECGQMYEAVISEEIRMREELKKAPLTPDVIRNFPTIVARLLLMGQPLELMDGDASNVPMTWLKSVLNQIETITNNAKVFVLSIIGVQSSGKSTLLNALFGLQFPVSAGRCSRGIYCHLVPIDKESLHIDYDYVLVVDTEGLASSEFTGKSTFRDNELATFAIGVADATIINMKGETWAEISNILQIVAYALIRIRKTKEDLELMPRCVFVHQNVVAADAKEKNRLGQDKQLALLDTAIKEASSVEGSTDITKFSQVIKYDPESHSWYFPDLWTDRPPKARISEGYIGRTNELRQYLMLVMKNNPSKLTISGFFLRMSDLWNAMLHNDFVLCFRNTQQITSVTAINDKISNAVDDFKNQNRLEQRKIHEFVCTVASAELLLSNRKGMLEKANDAVKKNFTIMMATLQSEIDATDISTELKKQYETLLYDIQEGEHLRINGEMEKEIMLQKRKLQYHSEPGVKDLKARLADLEKCIDEVEKGKLNDTAVKEFGNRWQQLKADNEALVKKRQECIESEIEKIILESIGKLYRKDKMLREIVVSSDSLKLPFNAEMPQVTENDIIQTSHGPTRLAMGLSKLFVDKANRSLDGAFRRWESQFQKQRGLGFDPSHLEQILFEVGLLLGISKNEECETSSEICSILPSGYRFSSGYLTKFIDFACHYIYNSSQENSQKFISMTDPISDIDQRYLRSVIRFRQMSEEAYIDAMSKYIFADVKRSFVRDLGELIKAEVCKDDNKNPTFMSKRAFLRAVISGLAHETENLTDVIEARKLIFKNFMLYIQMAESKASENFFHNAIIKLLKYTLTNESTSQTLFQRMVENNVGRLIEKLITALRHAEEYGEGCSREYMYVGFSDDGINKLSVNGIGGLKNKMVAEKIKNLYADFLSKANSSFEELVCDDNKAAIQTLFEKLMGCRERCPFCSAPCSQSIEMHAGDHRANHYPMGVGGTVESRGVFTNTHETHDASFAKNWKPRKLALSTCQAMVGSRVDIRTKVTVNKATKWYQSDKCSFNKLQKLREYRDWDIPYSRDHNASLYWKWFMAQFAKELALYYSALCPEIPEAWRSITWEEARRSLNDSDFNFYSGF